MNSLEILPKHFKKLIIFGKMWMKKKWFDFASGDVAEYII